MNIELSCYELKEILDKYIIEKCKELGNKNFCSSFNIKYYDGSYECDSSYEMQYIYSYSEELIVLGKKFVEEKRVTLVPKQIMAILSEVFKNDGYNLEYYYYHSKESIVFKVEKIEEMKLVLKKSK